MPIARRDVNPSRADGGGKEHEGVELGDAAAARGVGIEWISAEDAQRAWGGLQNFVREMPRLEEWLEILDMQVASVTVLDSWTDHLHNRTYQNVARLVMRYRLRQQWKEWTFDRQVHLIPATGGWRTLCYPTRAGVPAGR